MEEEKLEDKEEIQEDKEELNEDVEEIQEDKEELNEDSNNNSNDFKNVVSLLESINSGITKLLNVSHETTIENDENFISTDSLEDDEIDELELF